MIDLASAAVALAAAVASLLAPDVQSAAYVAGDLDVEASAVLAGLYTSDELSLHAEVAVVWMVDPRPYRAYVPAPGPDQPAECGGVPACVIVNPGWWASAGQRARRETLAHEYAHLIVHARYRALGPNGDPWDAVDFDARVNALANGHECIAEAVSQLVAARAGQPQPVPIYACDGSALPLAAELLAWAVPPAPAVEVEQPLAAGVAVAGETATRAPAEVEP